MLCMFYVQLVDTIVVPKPVVIRWSSIQNPLSLQCVFKVDVPPSRGDWRYNKFPVTIYRITKTKGHLETHCVYDFLSFQ